MWVTEIKPAGYNIIGSTWIYWRLWDIKLSRPGIYKGIVHGCMGVASHAHSVSHQSITRWVGPLCHKGALYSIHDLLCVYLTGHQRNISRPPCSNQQFIIKLKHLIPIFYPSAPKQEVYNCSTDWNSTWTVALLTRISMSLFIQRTIHATLQKFAAHWYRSTTHFPIAFFFFFRSSVRLTTVAIYV